MDITRAVINLKSLQHNLQVLQERAPKSKVLAVIKANAYGHGMVKIAGTLKGVYGFGVARLNEAIILRNAGINKPIILLEGFFYNDDISSLVEYNLQCVVHSQEQIDALKKEKLKKPLQIWLKIDTG
ncbi:MAG: alanine racemase, partial [Legionella sp.]|nr:alanine racemase [Legionella sp.]